MGGADRQTGRQWGVVGEPGCPSEEEGALSVSQAPKERDKEPRDQVVASTPFRHPPAIASIERALALFDQSPATLTLLVPCGEDDHGGLVAHDALSHLEGLSLGAPGPVHNYLCLDHLGRSRGQRAGAQSRRIRLVVLAWLGVGRGQG